MKRKHRDIASYYILFIAVRTPSYAKRCRLYFPYENLKNRPKGRFKTYEKLQFSANFAHKSPYGNLPDRGENCRPFPLPYEILENSKSFFTLKNLSPIFLYTEQMISNLNYTFGKLQSLTTSSDFRGYFGVFWGVFLGIYIFFFEGVSKHRAKNPRTAMPFPETYGKLPKKKQKIVPTKRSKLGFLRKRHISA